jgi:phosphoadenosine phosphosulfate reductase
MDEQLYLMAVGLSLDEKIEKAILNYQQWEAEALKLDPILGYYGCYSGGKDSDVIKALAKMAGVKIAWHHSLTTLDPPQLIMHIRKNSPDVIWHKPKIPMLKYMETSNKGPPSRRVRWCCEMYKEQGGNGFVKVTGVRAAESARRKAMWRVWQPRRESNSCMLNPILYWTDEDVWRFIKQFNVPYCSLYDEGMKRLGCIGCPLNPEQRARDFKRFPKIGEAWKRSMTRTWERLRHMKTEKGEPRFWSRFENAEDMWNWWMEENQPEAEDDCQMGLF